MSRAEPELETVWRGERDVYLCVDPYGTRGSGIPASQAEALVTSRTYRGVSALRRRPRAHDWLSRNPRAWGRWS